MIWWVKLEIIVLFAKIKEHFNLVLSDTAYFAVKHKYTLISLKTNYHLKRNERDWFKSKLPNISDPVFDMQCRKNILKRHICWYYISELTMRSEEMCFLLLNARNLGEKEWQSDRAIKHSILLATLRHASINRKQKNSVK